MGNTKENTIGMSCFFSFLLCVQNNPEKIPCITLNNYTKCLVFVMLLLLLADHCTLGVGCCFILKVFPEVWYIVHLTLVELVVTSRKTRKFSVYKCLYYHPGDTSYKSGLYENFVFIVSLENSHGSMNANGRQTRITIS